MKKQLPLNDYIIKINLTPHIYDNKKNPFFWCILAYYNSWCNEGSGWAETPEKAFSEAMDYYKKHIIT